MPSGVLKKIQLKDAAECVQLFGERDSTLRMLERSFQIQLVARGNEILLSGDSKKVETASEVIETLREDLRRQPQGVVSAEQVQTVIARYLDGGGEKTAEGEPILVSSKRRPVAPKTPGQARYVEALRRFDVVFGVGPAGTGKTYLAMAVAVAALRAGEVHRVILTRPAVEAGEKLGFLPGDLQEKVDPYLRPLYDALYDMVDYEKLQRLFQQKIVEVAPLAYMRGRTLSQAYIVLDEAQNTTIEQMKMFLTRLGVGSKMVVTGDITQVDLPEGKTSGLLHARSVLKGVPGVAFVELENSDIVRHRLVQNILTAYERAQSDDRKGTNSF